MPVFETIRGLRNGKKYEKATKLKMSESNGFETYPFLNSQEINIDNDNGTRILTQTVDG